MPPCLLHFSLIFHFWRGRLLWLHSKLQFLHKQILKSSLASEMNDGELNGASWDCTGWNLQAWPCASSSLVTLILLSHLFLSPSISLCSLILFQHCSSQGQWTVLHDLTGRIKSTRLKNHSTVVNEPIQSLVFFSSLLVISYFVNFPFTYSLNKTSLAFATILFPPPPPLLFGFDHLSSLTHIYLPVPHNFSAT